MQICDEAGKVPDAKQYLKTILRRLSHSDPHIGLKAVTVSKYFVTTFQCWLKSNVKSNMMFSF